MLTTTPPTPSTKVSARFSQESETDPVIFTQTSNTEGEAVDRHGDEVPPIVIVISILFILLQFKLHQLISNHDTWVSDFLALPSYDFRTDDTFNNVPIVHVQPSKSDFHSTAHCIGETFNQKMAWAYRSCAYKNLCFDMKESEFVLFRSQSQKTLDELVRSSDDREDLWTMASTLNTTVSIGGINSKWAKDQQASMEWSPIVRDYSEHSDIAKEGYYALPEGTVLIPFHR